MGPYHTHSLPTYNPYCIASMDTKRGRKMYCIIVFTFCMIVYMLEYRPVLMPKGDIQCINIVCAYTNKYLVYEPM